MYYWSGYIEVGWAESCGDCPGRSLGLVKRNQGRVSRAPGSCIQNWRSSMESPLIGCTERAEMMAVNWKRRVLDRAQREALHQEHLAQQSQVLGRETLESIAILGDFPVSVGYGSKQPGLSSEMTLQWARAVLQTSCGPLWPEWFCDPLFDWLPYIW